MKHRIIFIIFPLILLTGCGMIFKQGIDTGVTSFYNGIVPDSCDILLLNDVVDFRKINNTFPSNTWTVERVQMQSKECQSTYDSINVITFGKDSADIFLIKQFNNIDIKFSKMRKYYRLRFANDTLTSITPNLITSKDKYY
ncbi:MAG TPA: hypothetical protein VK179_10790 [Bacteroidales bacterium]|nr:hypothetical protein [Bacteroidales bacterium]